MKKTRLIGLRGKLLIVALTVFILPLAGFSYLQELESLLKKNHAESVKVIASTIASVFNDNAALINSSQLSRFSMAPFYSHPLKQAIRIDGYSDDWFELQNVQQDLTQNDHKTAAKLLIANDADYYYFLISVKKNTDPISNKLGLVSDTGLTREDIVNFSFLDYANRNNHYQFKLDIPGAVRADSLLNDAFRAQPDLNAYWQPVSRGYNLEFKIPTYMINRYISISADGIEPVSTNRQDTPRALLSVDPLNELKLQQLTPAATRLWLLDTQGYVNARTSKQSQTAPGAGNNHSLLSWFRRLYLLFMNFPEQDSQYGPHQYQIKNALTEQALNNHPGWLWLDIPYSERLTLAIAAPVKDREGSIIGVLYMEQDNNSLLALQDQTFERILLLTILLFTVIVLGLLFFSTRLLRRIIHLRNDTERALAQDGYISNHLFRNDNDEIGDLARSFSGLLSQVEQNNQYLKTLSGKLSHELRTPLTIIKSSLENTDLARLDENNKKYHQRALSGCLRLTDLLNRMSESSRLEQSIDSTEFEEFDLIGFLQHYIASVQAADSDTEFQFSSTIEHLKLQASPELLAQLMDKLLSNAVSFHHSNTPVQVRVYSEQHDLFIVVINYGPLIETDKLTTIFNSLTSYHPNRSADKEPHLGLGLYIARLICQYHKWDLTATNNYHQGSVSFIITIPKPNKEL